MVALFYFMKLNYDTKKCYAGGFKVTGKIPTQCSLTDPLSGELTVETSSVPIQSVDIHLIRIESILVGERVSTETSVIQATQVCYSWFTVILRQ